MRRKKPIIGLCGGIGSGKSLVAATFAELGCVVIDSDHLNHAVLRRPEVLAVLRGWWGERVLDAAGQPNRREIAKIIFTEAAEKRRLEELTYPLIASLREDMIRNANLDRAVQAIILDSPLLFESTLDRQCDTVIFVQASRPQRLERLRRTRGWDDQELSKRERWQLSLDEKRSRSEFVIDNGGSPEQLRPQVSEILSTILSQPQSAD